MKKFLSMLLALSVVFTYTFGAAGSVFAAEQTYNEKVTTAEKNVLDDLNAEYAKAVRDVTATKATDKWNTPEEVYGYAISVDSWKVALKAVYDDTVDAIQTQTNTLKATETDETVADLVAKYKSITKDDQGIADAAKGTEEYIVLAGKAQFAADKAAALENAGKVDTSVYSTTALAEGKEISFDTEKYSNNKDYADAIVAKVVANINAIVLASTDNTAEKVKDKVTDIATKFSEYLKATAKADDTVVYEIDDSKVTPAPLTKVKETADNALAEATKAGKIAAINSNATTAYSNFLKNANYDSTDADQAADFKAISDAYVAVWTYKVEQDANVAIADFPDYTVTKATTEAKGSVTETATGYVKNVAEYAKAEAKAAVVKVEKDADGNDAYDADKVDAILAKIKESAFEKTVNAYTYADTAFDDAKLTYLTDYQRGTAKEKVEAAKKVIMDKEPTVNNDYYALEKIAVEAAYNAVIAKVEAAKTISDLVDLGFDNDLTAYTAKADVTKDIKTKKNVDELFTTDAKVSAAFNAVKTKLEADIAYIVETSNGKYDKSDFNALTSDWSKVFIDGNVRTADEATAFYATAKAMVDAVLPAATVAENNKNAAAPVIALINNIPVVVTLADKATVKAAYEAYEALESAQESYVTNYNTLVLAISSVKKAEKTALDELYKGIKTLTEATVKITDKAAVKAVADAHTAYLEEEMYGSNIYSVPVGCTAASTLANKIRDLEKAEIIKAAKALPSIDKITLEDKAAVEAVRASYDAFVAEYEKIAATGGYDAKDNLKEAYAPLASAEAAIAAAEEAAKWTDKDVKAAMYDMSRKVTIWRTSKTSIRVTAVGSVSNIKKNGYTVKYTFYKKAPGAKAFKAVKTTTSNKFVYKNLKKGTNKFQVKVKVYDAEGKLVASKTTFYRAAKVK